MNPSRSAAKPVLGGNMADPEAVETWISPAPSDEPELRRK